LPPTETSNDHYEEKSGLKLRIVVEKVKDDISWETEVWIAESPTHLIHFNGERFLGPYEEQALTRQDNPSDS
jgi:hypothetical protein